MEIIFLSIIIITLREIRYYKTGLKLSVFATYVSNFSFQNSVRDRARLRRKLLHLHNHLEWWRVVVVIALVMINEVTLRRGLVSTWMGDCLWTGKPSLHVTSHPGQLSLAIPPWVGTMSISESWGVNRHTVQYTSPVSMVSQCKLVSG